MKTLAEALNTWKDTIVSYYVLKAAKEEIADLKQQLRTQQKLTAKALNYTNSSLNSKLKDVLGYSDLTDAEWEIEFKRIRNDIENYTKKKKK